MITILFNWIIKSELFMYYGEKTILRGLKTSDIHLLMNNWNNLEMRKNLRLPVPNSQEEEEQWIINTWEQRKSKTGYVFAITTLEDEWLGTCGLRNVDLVNRSAVLGIAIHDKKNWGKGFGTDAALTLCAFGFNIINLHRIQLEYFDFNVRGARSYEKIGFKTVGARREAYYVLGKYHDSIVMDLLKDEFEEKYPNFNLLQS